MPKTRKVSMATRRKISRSLKKYHNKGMRKSKMARKRKVMSKRRMVGTRKMPRRRKAASNQRRGLNFFNI